MARHNELRNGLTDGSIMDAWTKEVGSIASFSGPLEKIFGRSALNPGNFRNNCVSVCIAKLLAYRDVDELWKSTYGYRLPDQPLNQTAIIDLVQRTGWKFRWETYHLTPGQSVRESIVSSDMYSLIYGISRALLYVRSDGTGHCVIWDTLSSDMLPLCYQHDNEGLDVTQDIVSHTDTIYLLRLQCPRNTDLHEQWRDRLVQRMIERREQQESWSLPYRVYMRNHKTVRDRIWGSFDAFLRTWNTLPSVLDGGEALFQGLVKTNDDLAQTLKQDLDAKFKAKL